MFESLFFLIIICIILYVIFWAMIKDDGQRNWWEDYRDVANKSGTTDDGDEDTESAEDMGEDK